MRFIYVFSLFACVSVGFVAGTLFTQAQQAYMDTERANAQYFKAGEKRGICIANRMHLGTDTKECFNE